MILTLTALFKKKKKKKCEVKNMNKMEKSSETCDDNVKNIAS